MSNDTQTISVDCHINSNTALSNAHTEISQIQQNNPDQITNVHYNTNTQQVEFSGPHINGSISCTGGHMNCTFNLDGIAKWFWGKLKDIYEGRMKNAASSDYKPSSYMPNEFDFGAMEEEAYV